MRRTGKRLLALTLSFLLVCLLTATVWASAPSTACPDCSHQAAIGTTHYNTLAEALANAMDEDTVTLLQDLTTERGFLVDKSITLDLGGKTIKNDDLLTNPLLTVTAPVTLKGGQLTAQGIVVRVQDSDLTLDEDAVLSGSGAAPTVQALATTGTCRILVQENAKILSEAHTAVEMTGKASLKITGGTITAKSDALSFTYTKPETLSLAISGGEITAKEGKLIVINALDGAAAPSKFVTGGTFSHSPSAYTASGYRVLKNTDGTYTVVALRTVSFSANGGKGKMSAKQVIDGDTIKLPKCGFTAPGGKDFKGWQIGGKTYAPGDKVTITEDITVKALWKTHTHSGGKATCESKAKCEGCGKTYGSTGSHTLKKVSGYDATCTEAGRIAHSKCTVCGKRFADGEKISSVTIPAFGHDLIDHEGKEPTCQETGLLAHQECDRCGKLFVDGKKTAKKDLTLPVSGHAMETVEAVAATCIQAGTLAHQHCTDCDRIFLNGEETQADALTTGMEPHLLSDWISDEKSHWKTCVECDAQFRLHSHKDADNSGSCDECGYSMVIVEVVTPSQDAETTDSFSPAFLIPVAIAAVIAAGVAVSLVLKKRKNA